MMSKKYLVLLYATGCSAPFDRAEMSNRESEVRKMKTLITRLINTVCDADKSNMSAITKFLRRNISVGMMVKLDSLTK